MNIKEILNWPIISGSQFGDIYIGMSLDRFKNIYIKDRYVADEILVIISAEKDPCFVFYDCIRISFYSNVLQWIILNKGYKGKFKKSVSIGSSIIDIKKVTDDYIYDPDDDDYWIEFDDSEIELEVTNPFSWNRTDEQLAQCFITEMKLDSFQLWEKAVNAVVS